MSRSGFTSSTVRITSSNCVTSPRTTGAPIGAPVNVAAPGFRSMPTTDSPRATSRLMSRGPMKPVAPITSTDIPCLLILPRGLPGDHPPVVPGLRVDRQVADGEAILLTVPLHVHVRHAVDDADISMDARPPLARHDAAVVWLAGPEVRDVLGLRLLARGGVDVDQVVRQRRVERGPVARSHRLESTVVGAENVRPAPGPLSSEMPTWAACSLCASSDCRSHRPKSAFKWSGTPPQDSSSCSYALTRSRIYGLSGPKNVLSDRAASARASWLFSPQKAWTLLPQYSLTKAPTGVAPLTLAR